MGSNPIEPTKPASTKRLLHDTMQHIDYSQLQQKDSMKARQPQDKRIQRGNRRAVTTRILGGRLAAAWRTMLLAMMLAVSWQGFVAQTHHHPDSGSPFGISTASATVLVDVAAGVDRKTPLKLPDSCPICRELAHAGSALLPTPAVYIPPVALAAPAADPLPALQTRVRPLSHGWQSRAPPQPLQA